MWLRSSHHISFAVVIVVMCTLLSSCNPNGSNPPDEPIVSINESLVLATDSANWYVALFADGLLYADAMEVTIPSPYFLPTKQEAKILRDLNYPHHERFVTSDGYTFGMPSASVSKAGSKTKYSVLGVRIKHNTIKIEF